MTKLSSHETAKQPALPSFNLRTGPNRHLALKNRTFPLVFPTSNNVDSVWFVTDCTNSQVAKSAEHSLSYTGFGSPDKVIVRRALSNPLAAIPSTGRVGGMLTNARFFVPPAAIATTFERPAGAVASPPK